MKKGGGPQNAGCDTVPGNDTRQGSVLAGEPGDLQRNSLPVVTNV